jgi:hypothetical protein
LVYAALAALVAMAAPLLFYRFTLPHGPDDIWLVPWAFAAVVGPLVFQSISRPRPKLKYGLAFAAVMAVVFGVWAGIQVPFEGPSAAWPVDQRAGIGAFFFLMAFIGGSLGALLASFIAVLVGQPRVWRAGVLIVVLDVVVAAILVGVPA